LYNFPNDDAMIFANKHFREIIKLELTNLKLFLISWPFGKRDKARVAAAVCGLR
jgi:hypothetical protein